MSTPDRLERLGLSHLANKPDELREALMQGYAKDRNEVLRRQAQMSVAEWAEHAESLGATHFQNVNSHDSDNTPPEAAAQATTPSWWQTTVADFREGFREKPIRTILASAFGLVFFGLIAAWTVFLVVGTAYFAWTEVPRQIPRHPFVSAIIAVVAGLALGYKLFRSPADKVRDRLEGKRHGGGY